IRTGLDGDRLDAGPRRKTHPGRIASARGFEGGAGDCAVDAEQYSYALAGASPGSTRRGGIREHFGLVYPHGGAANRTFAALRKNGTGISGGDELRRAYLSCAPGSAEQREPAFRGQ